MSHLILDSISVFHPPGTFFAFFTAAQYETVYDDEEKEDVRILKFKDSITFDYDESTQKLTAPKGGCLYTTRTPTISTIWNMSSRP